MDYIDQINRAVEYIEENLGAAIQVDTLAKKAAMSKWHFQRTFRAMVGDTIKEYTEKRRVSLAAKDLVSTDLRVLDIALAYGFESHEVFTRAFKRVFMMTPNEFRSKTSDPAFIPLKAAITREYLDHLYGGISMEPEIKQLTEMTVVGLVEKIHTVHDKEFSTNLVSIPALWQLLRSRLSELPQDKIGKAVGIIGQDSESIEAIPLEYVAGYVSGEKFDAPNEFVWRTIPGGEYAEFTHKGPVSRINHTMNYIYGSWFPKSGRQRGRGPEVSLRNENYDPQAEDGEVKILIPLVQSSS